MTDTPLGVDRMVSPDLVSAPPQPASQYFHQAELRPVYANILKQFTGQEIDSLGVSFVAGPPRIVEGLNEKAKVALVPDLANLFGGEFWLEKPTSLIVRTRKDEGEEVPVGLGLVFFGKTEQGAPVMRIMWLITDPKFKAPIPSWVDPVRQKIQTLVDGTGTYLPMQMWPNTLYPQKDNPTDVTRGTYLSEIYLGVGKATDVVRVVAEALDDLRAQSQWLPVEPGEKGLPHSDQEVVMPAVDYQKGEQPLDEGAQIKQQLSSTEKLRVAVTGDERSIPAGQLLRRVKPGS